MFEDPRINVNVTDDLGRTLLHNSCINKNNYVTHGRLIKDPRVNTSIKDIYGNSFLYYVFNAQSKELIQIIINPKTY